MSDRHEENIKTVRIIADKFGYGFHSYDYGWYLCNLNGHQYLVRFDDIFMGRLALSFGLNWKFKDSEDEIINLIEVHGEHIDYVDEQGWDDIYKEPFVRYKKEFELELKIRRELQENANEIKSTE